MRFILLLCILFPIGNTAVCQTFLPAPGPHLEKAVQLMQATECYIFFENPGGDTLQLRWKQIEISAPATWVVDLCDYGLCYTGVPASGIMNPAADTAQPYLKLIVQPGDNPGVAWFWFRVWENGNPTNFQDVFFDLHTPGVTSTREIETAAIEIFPNPVSNFFYIKNTSPQTQTARLLDAAGRIKWTGSIPAQQTQNLDCTNWPAGAYFLQTKNQTLQVLRF